MSRRVRAASILATCSLLLVAGAMAGLRQCSEAGGSRWGAQSLEAYARRKAPLSDAQRDAARLNLTRLAEEDDHLLDWLVSVVRSSDVTKDLRCEVLDCLWELRSDDAIRKMAQGFLPWLAKRWESQEEMQLHLNVRLAVSSSLFRSSLPAEEILGFLEQDRLGWRRVDRAFGTQTQSQSAHLSEDQKRQGLRHSEVLALARSRDEAKLMAKVLAEAPLAEGVRPELADLARLADADPAFRKWLAGVVASPGEDVWVRVAAFRPLLGIPSDAAVRDLVADLRAWLLNRNAEVDSDGRELQTRVSDLLLDRLLLTDLPIEEVMELAKQSFLRRGTRVPALAKGIVLGGGPWTKEQVARLQERAMAWAEAQDGQLLRHFKDDLARQKRTEKARQDAP